MNGNGAYAVTCSAKFVKIPIHACLNTEEYSNYTGI